MLRSTDTTGAHEYAAGANSVLAVLDQALDAAGRDRNDVQRWLDFGCGYGRVCRFLVQDVQPDRVWVTDVLPEAVRFSAKEFGVHPVFDLAARDDLRETFDLIYAISVFTHIPLAEADTLAGLLASCLTPGGLLVFTTHGRDTLASIRPYGSEFVDQRERIKRELDQSDASYRPYIHSKDGTYGVAWHTERYVKSLVDRCSDQPMKLIDCRPRGLNIGDQDVYVYER